MNQRTVTFAVKKSLVESLNGGVVMDVVTPGQARIAEDAGAVAVIASAPVTPGVRAQAGVARMNDPEQILRIMDAVSIPVMAKCRIGHFVETQILEAIGVDFIDESEVQAPADAALLMQLGMDGVFVGSSVFKSRDTARWASAVVKATTQNSDPYVLAEVSRNQDDLVEQPDLQNRE